ncbi:MAG TPA: hypothetical protein PKO07_21485 [Pseudomonadota bacterium]|jgi:hypothetical protein|nr:hypothetical protein [Pseudomonadota bacterium]
MSSDTAAIPIEVSVHASQRSSQLDDALLLACRDLGLSESLGRELRQHRFDDAQLGDVKIRSLLALAALSRGDVAMADDLLATGKPIRTIEERRLWLAASLYRTCWLNPPLPDEVASLTQALGNATSSDAVDAPEWSPMALGCATLAFAEGLLRMSDVGAARNQLEVVATGERLPRGLAVVARTLLASIEIGVGRSDLAIGHLQVALHASADLGAEDRFLRLLLIGLLLGENRRLALAMLDDLSSGRYEKIDPTLGTVGRLYSVLSAISYSCPLSLAATIQLRRDLAWLLKRHASAAWCLLLLSIISGALVCSDETCEGYDILVQSAAELRCRYMDGVADLLDRQLATLRGQLGPDGFEPVVREAQRRRRLRASKD